MSRYLPSKMELGPRDIISRAIINEIKEGQAFSGPHGPFVMLDIRHLGEKTINEKLPLVREISLEFAGIDPVKEPIPVTPVAHYFMGGVSTNLKTETTVPGLFAAGETACVTINGANRLGSNSLSECLVFGKVAGENAADAAAQNESSAVSQAQLNDEENRISAFLKKEGNEKVSEVRESLQQIMQEHAGIERSAKSLETGLNQITALSQRFQNIALGDRGMLFNTELTSIFELQNMMDIAEAVVRSAMPREESRGSHFRSDFPARDDKRFLKHLVSKRAASGMMIEEKPVTITRWQPQERKY